MSNADFSDLEREFELEMEGPSGNDFELEFEGDQGSAFEWGADNEQTNYEQSSFGTSFDQSLEQEFEQAFEQADVEHEWEAAYGDGRSGEFVERFLEIGSRQFESSYEADAAMGEVLDDIEREYFFGALKRGLKRLSKNKLLRSLASKGLTMGVNKFFPGLKGALQLARGNVKGALLNFGKQALGSVVPGGGAMIDAAQSMGLAPGGGAERERETWENYVDLSREAYEHLAENLTPTAHQPAEAMRLANNAVQHAIARAKTRAIGGPRPGGIRSDRRSHHAGRVVRLRVAPGERLKLIIVGS